MNTPLNQPSQHEIKSPQVDMLALMSDPRNRGKHIIAVGNKVFTAKTGPGAAKILKKVRREYPNNTPKITYVPDTDLLIV